MCVCLLELIHQVSVLSEQSNANHLQSLLMELREQEERNEETLALRHAYMQSGGSDPAIVAQMIDLQAEAQSLEKNQPAAARGPSWELLAVEEENQRLEKEIHRFQLARERHRNYEGWRVWFYAPHLRSFSSPFERRMMDPLDSLGPSPYDPEAGFVVFFDLVTGVDASQKVLRLVTALYSEGHEIRPPTSTPPVQCQLGEPYPHSPGNYALLSVKQPVTRIQPSPSLCLVVEVQTAKDLDVYNQEVFKLVACGWTQLELFDQYNQLRSGYWRLPVRSLPVRPSLNLPQLNSLPQVGHMELCVRLVNGRNEDAQTQVKPELNTSSRYKYLAVVG
uniref:Coiled-coil domain containing 17 n=1 Tax=Anabas testudineus TaxID=64144 RepID=A0A3Q1JDQ1_ANATE